MKQFKTTRAAWLYLARRWDVARRGTEYAYYTARVAGRHTAYGLCHAIGSLIDCGALDSNQGISMRIKMSGLCPNGASPNGYWWKRDKRGARARAAFCRRIARLED